MNSNEYATNVVIESRRIKAKDFSLKPWKNEERRMANRHLHPFIGDRPACAICGKRKWDKIHKEEK